LTKLDVLSGFDTIQIGARYLHEGKEVRGMPASIGTYAAVEVEYETMPGWQEDISKCRTFEELPPNCQAYVLRLQELLAGPRIRWIGVGNGRADLIEVTGRTAQD
jgi:adenylosuccinate synthase